MSVVEIRCPRCGSVCHEKNDEEHEYLCEHCGATFRFVDATRREVVHDTRAHNCPLCGRSVEAGKGYVCKECGKEYLCENCIEIIRERGFEKIVCKECLKQKGLSCSICSSKYEHFCVVCGKKYCDEHTSLFMDNLPSVSEIHHHGRELRKKGYAEHPARIFALYCPHCEGYVCHRCYVKKSSFWGGEGYYCKKCGSKLRKESPLSREYSESY